MITTGTVVQWVIDAARATALDWRVTVDKTAVALRLEMPRERLIDHEVLPTRVEITRVWAPVELESAFGGAEHVRRQVATMAADLRRGATR